MRKLLVGTIIFLFFYSLFWVYFFRVTLFKKSTILSSSTIALPTPTIPVMSSTNHHVPGATSIQMPQSYMLSVVPRKQVFNLSCEFAAAAAIMYFYKNDEMFSPKNELDAEKTLIAKIPASLNPNIGIRMGESATTSADLLYENLDKKFGGTDYYGVHAPPFIDVFWEYGLLARPIKKGDIDGIKKAIFSGHLVMTWIRVGYGQKVDVELFYGTTPVVKGEHVVVMYGYDENGVFIMDPGIGVNRSVSYSALLDATQPFPLPFLEVNPSIKEFSYDPTERVDQLTGLDRTIIKIRVESGSREVGAGNTMAEILRDFGYTVNGIEKVEDSHEGISVLLKKDLSDYRSLIKKDILLAGYQIASFSATLAPESSTDAVVVVGE